MVDDEYAPNVPEHSAAIDNALSHLLGDTDVPDTDYYTIASYINREIDGVMHQSSATSYLLLGSYRSPYMRRLRAAQHELTNRRTDSVAVVLGDTTSLDLDGDIPEFLIEFHLLASTANYIALVLEKGSGGENDELGKITTLYDQKSHLFPRDYAGRDPDPTESESAVKRVAIAIYTDDSRTDDEKEHALRELASAAADAGMDISETDIRHLLQARESMAPEGEPTPPARYPWPQLSDFQRFDSTNDCYPWFTPREFRAEIQLLPE